MQLKRLFGNALVALLLLAPSTATSEEHDKAFNVATCKQLFRDVVPDQSHRQDLEAKREAREVMRSPGGVGGLAPALQTSVDLTAGEENGRGTLTYSGTLNSPHGSLSTWAVSASVPFDKTKGEGVFASLTGLGGDIVIKGERNRFKWNLQPVKYGERLCEICQEVGVPTMFDCSIDGLQEHLGRILSLDDETRNRIDREVKEKSSTLRGALSEACQYEDMPPELECSVEGLETLWRAELTQAAREEAAAKPTSLGAQYEEELLNALFGKVAGRFWGIEGSVGQKDRKFFELNGDKLDEDRVGLSASLVGGLALSNGTFYARLIGKRDYKENDKVTRCTAVPDSEVLETCEERPLGRADKVESLSAGLEWRRFFNKLAISPSVAYDLEIEEWATQFPIYLVRNKDGAFTGGLKLIYGSETDEFSAAVFVSKPLGL